MDEVSTIIKESIETVIGGNAYTSAKVNNWTSQVVENVLGNLSKLNKAFKYIGEFPLLFHNILSGGKVNYIRIIMYHILSILTYCSYKDILHNFVILKAH